MGYLHIARRIENGTAFLGNYVALSYKTRHTTAGQPNHCPLGYIQKSLSKCL